MPKIFCAYNSKEGNGQVTGRECIHGIVKNLNIPTYTQKKYRADGLKCQTFTIRIGKWDLNSLGKLKFEATVYYPFYLKQQ